MKVEQVEAYRCEICGKLFLDKDEEAKHEKKIHGCLNCKHHFFLYGSELTCDAKKCEFDKIDDNDDKL